MLQSMSALSNSHDYEEEHEVEVERNYDPKYHTGEGAADKSAKQSGVYDEASSVERGVENLYTDLSCLCRPACTLNPCQVVTRTGSWFLSNADQFISSIIVAISLIPESISYALIAGLPPSAGLQSCWIMNVITAAVGGRPGMITSASGLSALLLHRLVQTNTVAEESGIMFIPYVIIFAGILQCIAAVFGLGRLVSSFPASVVVGMVNAMAILILVLQCRYVKDFPLTAEEMVNGWNIDGTAPAVDIKWNISLFAYFGLELEWITPWLSIVIFGVEVLAAFLISLFLPKLTTSLPATLVGVLVVVAVEFGLARQFGVETPLIGDYGGAQVDVPWDTIFTSNFNLPTLTTWENWKLILGYGSTLFVTQFTETAIALNVVDSLDESQGPGFLVLVGQGIANVVCAIMGGMGGSGVVSSSVLADRTFGTSCLSTFMTGIMVFVFVGWGWPVIDYIPLSAISGISLSVVWSFVQWKSMAATFTTCLPSDTRDNLPSQYNVARFDVLIMLLVTAACLIVDVATLLFFVLALVIFTYGAIRSFIGRKNDIKNEIMQQHTPDSDLVGDEYPSPVADEDGQLHFYPEIPVTNYQEEAYKQRISGLTEEERTHQKMSTVADPCSALCGIK